jgi:hypothetical protein
MFIAIQSNLLYVIISEEAVLTLESVEFQMPLREIYERIKFEVSEEEASDTTSEIQE